MARIAIDIDSTLHHYWDLFRSIVRERHGVDLAYENQTGWGITQIPQESVRQAVSETHSDDNIAGAVGCLNAETKKSSSWPCAIQSSPIPETRA